jgi:hypothetical protein
MKEFHQSYESDLLNKPSEDQAKMTAEWVMKPPAYLKKMSTSIAVFS